MPDVSNFNIRVNVESKQAEAQMQGLSKNMQSGMNNIKQSAMQAGAGFAKMAAGIGVAVIAANQIIDVIGGFVEAAQIQEEAERKFTKALELSGNTAEGASQKYFDLASRIQDVTTVGDEATIQLMQLALSMGVTEDNLEGATKGAIGLSKSLGMDLNTSLKMVTLGINGEYTMLGRYIPALRTATTEAEKAAVFQKALADGFELAKDEAETSSGKMQQLSNDFGDLKEKLGDILLPVIDAAVEGLTNLVDGVQSIIDAIKEFNAEKLVDGFVSSIRSLAEYSTLGLSETGLGWVGLGKEIDTTKEKVENFGETTEEVLKPQGPFYRNLALIREELKMYREDLENAKSAADETIAKANIARLEAELAARTGKGGKKAESKPIAGSIAAMEAALKKYQEAQSNAIAGSQKWAEATLNIARVKGELDALNRVAEAMSGRGPDTRGISPFEKMAMDIAMVPEVLAPAVDASVTLLDQLGASYEELANVVTSVMGSLATLFNANFEEMKLVSIAEAVVNTAVGVTKALGQGGWLGIAGAVSVGLAGAAQIKTIIDAKPGSGAGSGAAAISGIAQSGSAPQGSGRQINRLALSGGDSGRSIALQGEFVVRGTDLVLALNNNTRVTEGAGI